MITKIVTLATLSAAFRNATGGIVPDSDIFIRFDGRLLDPNVLPKLYFQRAVEGGENTNVLVIEPKVDEDACESSYAFERDLRDARDAAIAAERQASEQLTCVFAEVKRLKAQVEKEQDCSTKLMTTIEAIAAQRDMALAKLKDADKPVKAKIGRPVGSKNKAKPATRAKR